MSIYKDAIDKIRLLLSAESQEAPAQEEAPAEAPQEETPAAPAEETPAEAQEVALEEAQPDYTAQIAAMQEKITALEATIQGYATIQEAVNKAEAKFAAFTEALNQTHELILKLSDEPSEDPAQAPKNSLKKEKKTNLDKYIQAL